MAELGLLVDDLIPLFKGGNTKETSVLFGVVSSAAGKPMEVLIDGDYQARAVNEMCVANKGDRVLCLRYGDGSVAAIAKIKGDAGLSGSKVNITTPSGEVPGSLFVNGRDVFINKVLWSGKWYMNASQEINLTEPISQQPSGVVLMWSRYKDGDAEDSNFTFSFVPKYFVSKHNGKGINSPVAYNANLANKYVYIHDTKIVGHSRNNTAYTFMGTSVDLKTWVLRYVVGV